VLFSLNVGAVAAVLFAVAIGVGFELVKWWIGERRRSLDEVSRFEVTIIIPGEPAKSLGRDTQQSE